jgi:hypothetical protein
MSDEITLDVMDDFFNATQGTTNDLPEAHPISKQTYTFDPSVSSIEISDVNIDVIEASLYALLIKRFTEKERHVIHKTSKGYKMCCIYCGDSKDPSKKRGTVYLPTFSYKCWNCNIYKPLDDMVSGVSGIDRKTVDMLQRQHIIKNSANKSSLAEFYNKDTMLDKEKIMKALYLEDMKESRAGIGYLKSRNAFDGINLSDMAYNRRYDNLVTFNEFNGGVLGIQLRLGTPMKNGGRFISYSYGDILEKLFKLPSEEIDHDLVLRMNKIALTYNILNVNLGKDVNVFESALDSKYFDNSVAAWGAGNSFVLDDRGCYYYDNDKAGRKMAMKMLDVGCRVFLWGKFFKDPRYRAISINQSKIKDINDIKKIDGSFDVKNILPQFISNDKFDKLYI